MTVERTFEESEIHGRTRRGHFFKRTHRIEVKVNDKELQDLKDKAKAARLALATYIRVSALMYRRKSLVLRDLKE